MKNSYVRVTENAEKGGIEIRYNVKPPATTLTELKVHGWRWSRYGRCWWHRKTSESVEFVKQYGATLSETQPASNEDYPCSDMGYEDQCARACGAGL